jgi:hypothetical protein
MGREKYGERIGYVCAELREQRSRYDEIAHRGEDERFDEQHIGPCSLQEWTDADDTFGGRMVLARL